MTSSEADRPTISTAYLEHLDAQTTAAALAAEPMTSDFDGAPQEHLDRLERQVEADGADLVSLLHTLHQDPEVAYQEVRAAALIAQTLSERGIQTQVGVHGVDTAVRAQVQTPGFDPDRHRTVAVLAEYDALPGIGHACGHNVIAATGVGAFLALHALVEHGVDGVEGRVVFLGTPAEEGHTGKEVMARGGAFAGIDAAVMVHPFGYDTASHLFLGRRLLTVEYTGQSAHASAQPFMGRNALDAASLAYQGIGLLRQQIPSPDRVHAVIVEGGTRPSIITEYARLDVYVRSAYADTLKDLSERVERVMRGAAMMTDTAVQISWDAFPPSLPVRTNGVLAARWSQAQQHRRRDPHPAGVVPEALAASTDFGNVSVRLPGIHPMIAISEPDIALHTPAFAEAAATPRAESAALDGAFGLAVSAWDFVCDDTLAQAATEEFLCQGGPIDVETYFD